MIFVTGDGGKADFLTTFTVDVVFFFLIMTGGLTLSFDRL